MDLKIRNLTGHEVTIYDTYRGNPVVFEPEPVKAWAVVDDHIIADITVGEGVVSIVKMKSGGVMNLPDFDPGTLLLVSKPVVDYGGYPSRGDLVFPHKIVTAGKVRFAKSLALNPWSETLWVR